MTQILVTGKLYGGSALRRYFRNVGIVALLLFLETTMTSCMITGFGGTTFNTSSDFTAGVLGGVIYPVEYEFEAFPFGLLVEGEAGWVFGEETHDYFTINSGPGFWRTNVETWSFFLMPYVIGGVGALDGHTTINGGGGITTFPDEEITTSSWGLRLDYRHFFCPDDTHLEFDRAILGLQFLFLPAG